MDIANRLRELISHLGITDKAFANRCGILQNTLSRQLNGIRDVSLSTIVSVKERYPEVSSDWLLTGEGEMFLDKPVQDDERLNKLIDTIAFLQATVSEQHIQIDKLEDEKKKLIAENVMLKNEGRIV